MIVRMIKTQVLGTMPIISRHEKGLEQTIDFCLPSPVLKRLVGSISLFQISGKLNSTSTKQGKRERGREVRKETFG